MDLSNDERPGLALPNLPAQSGEVAVDLLAVEATHKGDRTVLEDKAEATISHANAVGLPPLASSRLRFGIS